MFFQVVAVFALICSSHGARTPGEIRTWFLEQAMECNKQKAITADEMMRMKSHDLPESENAKCLMACVMRKTKFINDNGDFDVDNANVWAAKEYNDSPKQLEGSKKLYDLCKKVNDETVSDGAKGCQRAYHLTKCLLENAPKMGFSLQ